MVAAADETRTPVQTLDNPPPHPTAEVVRHLLKIQVARAAILLLTAAAAVLPKTVVSVEATTVDQGVLLRADQAKAEAAPLAIAVAILAEILAVRAREVVPAETTPGETPAVRAEILEDRAREAVPAETTPEETLAVRAKVMADLVEIAAAIPDEIRAEHRADLAIKSPAILDATAVPFEIPAAAPAVPAILTMDSDVVETTAVALAKTAA